VLARTATGTASSERTAATNASRDRFETKTGEDFIENNLLVNFKHWPLNPLAQKKIRHRQENETAGL
jgi:hypothetical protein